MQSTPSDVPAEQHHTLGRRAGLVLLSALVVLLPISQFLRPGLWPNQPDIDVVAWSIAHAGHYFNVHGHFPVSLDSEKFAGNVQPVFYAPILFPLLGLISQWAGVAAVFRAAVLVVWTLQYLLVSRVVYQTTRRRWTAVGVAAWVCWTIYPLSNLYHRGAFAEVIATTLLTCASAAGLLALLERERLVRIAMILLCAWCGTLAAASHSITAIVGGIVVGCLALAALHVNLRPVSRIRRHLPPGQQSRQRHASRVRYAIVAALAVLVTIVLSPWLYVSARYGASVAVAGKTGKLVYEPQHDSIFVRLSPLPLNDSPDAWPYNHPQLNTPLLLVLIWTLSQLMQRWRRSTGIDRRRLMVRWLQWNTLLRVSLVLLALTLLLSTSSTIIRHLPAWFSFIQYAYRLITYSNLAMLTALLAAWGILYDSRSEKRCIKPIGKAVWAIAIALSAAGLVMKLVYASRTLVPATLSAMWHNDPDTAAHAPPRYYVQKAYVVPHEGGLLSDEPVAAFQNVRTASLPVGTGTAFGVAQPVTIQQPTGGWVLTNITSFPWNQLLLDGTPIPPSEVRESSQQLALYVPAGTHTIGYRTVPSRTWTVLHWLSIIVFALLTVAVALVWASETSMAAFFDRRGRSAHPV